MSTLVKNILGGSGGGTEPDITQTVYWYGCGGSSKTSNSGTHYQWIPMDLSLGHILIGSTWYAWLYMETSDSFSTSYDYYGLAKSSAGHAASLLCTTNDENASDIEYTLPEGYRPTGPSATGGKGFIFSSVPFFLAKQNSNSDASLASDDDHGKFFYDIHIVWTPASYYSNYYQRYRIAFEVAQVPSSTDPMVPKSQKLKGSCMYVCDYTG